MLLWHKGQIMFTAENGAALNIEWVCYNVSLNVSTLTLLPSLHYPSKPRSRLDKLKDRLVIRVWPAFTRKKTAEQAKVSV